MNDIGTARAAELSSTADEAIPASVLVALKDLHGRIEAILARAGRDVPRPITRFIVQVDQRAIFINAADVDWCEAAGNYINIHVGSERYRLRLTLAGLAERLDARQFVRIHKSTVVNIDRIREVQPWFGGDHIAVLRDGRKLRVSRTYASALLRHW